MTGSTQAPNNTQPSSKPDEVMPVSVVVWRGYLLQRRRSLRTELAEIENILHVIAEQGIDKTPG